MSSVNLKPCPHCGGNASMSIDPEATTDQMGRRWAFTVVCENCCATSGLNFSEENAVESWNRRATVDQHRWVPVTERMPENDETAICYMKDGKVLVLTWSYIDWMWDNGSEWYKEDDVLYWMPLPKPPKEE